MTSYIYPLVLFSDHCFVNNSHKMFPLSPASHIYSHSSHAHARHGRIIPCQSNHNQIETRLNEVIDAAKQCKFVDHPLQMHAFNVYTQFCSRSVDVTRHIPISYKWHSIVLSNISYKIFRFQWEQNGKLLETLSMHDKQWILFLNGYDSVLNFF